MYLHIHLLYKFALYQLKQHTHEQIPEEERKEIRGKDVLCMFYNLSQHKRRASHQSNLEFSRQNQN
jgi:hypothetical protein